MVPSTMGAMVAPVVPKGRRVRMAGVWHDADVDESEVPTPRVEVAVVGTVNLDHTVRVRRLPAAGETVVGDAVSTALGGKGANQAVAAARQGARAALVACVGDDPDGADLLDLLGAEANLDTRGVRRVPGSTGSAFVAIDDSGANTVVSERGVNELLDEEQVHRNGPVIAGAAVLLVQLGVARDAIRAALEIARSVGTITVLDPSPPDDVTDDLLRLVDICTPNETEAERLTGIPVDDLAGARAAAAALVARGCACAVVTLGARGAVCASSASAAVVVAPFTVDVLDPTGAGDAFCGALAAALAHGGSFDDALTRGSAAGALAATRIGAAASLPTRAEVDGLVARQAHDRPV